MAQHPRSVEADATEAVFRERVALLLMIATDISERLEAKEIRAKGLLSERQPEATSSFLATMSHDVRTPLNALVNMVSVIESDGFEMVDPENFRVLKTSAKHLLALVNDVLEFSKIESVTLTLESESFLLREMLDDVVQMFEGAARSRGVTLHLGDVPAALSAEFCGDAGRLRQMVGRQQGGTGLGLAIVKKMAVTMLGTAGGSFRLGQGSSFWIEIALETWDASQTALNGKSAREQRLVLGLWGLSVEQQTAITRHAGVFGWTTTIFESQERVLVAAQSNPGPTLVVTDHAWEADNAVLLPRNVLLVPPPEESEANPGWRLFDAVSLACASHGCEHTYVFDRTEITFGIFFGLRASRFSPLTIRCSILWCWCESSNAAGPPA